MPSSVRWVLGIALSCVLAISLTVGATVASVYQAGTISVSVQPRGGGGIDIAVPAASANMAFSLLRWLPHGALPLDHASDEVWDSIDTYLPFAQQALEQLAAQPDFTLVEVESDGEHIVVQKVGRTMQVLVDSDEGRVDVSIPLKTVRQFTRQLRRLSDR